MGEAPEHIVLVETEADVDALEVADPEKLAYVSQTTLSVDETRAIINRLRERFPSIIGPRTDDICYATTNRQAAVKQMAPHCDLVLVIGSRNSSNSNRLVEVAREHGADSLPHRQRGAGARGVAGGHARRRHHLRAPAPPRSSSSASSPSSAPAAPSTSRSSRSSRRTCASCSPRRSARPSPPSRREPQRPRARQPRSPGASRPPTTSRPDGATGPTTRSRGACGRSPRRASRSLPEVDGRDVIELGCGTAYVSAWLARRGARPVGIDITPEQLATARALQAEHGLDFPLIEGSAEAVPLPDDSFDVAISEYGASLWCDPEAWIPEAARLLRPGGRLWFLTNTPLVMLTMHDEDEPSRRGARAAAVRDAPLPVERRLGRVPPAPRRAHRAAAPLRLRGRGAARAPGARGRHDALRVRDAGVGAPLALRGDLGRPPRRSAASAVA